MDRAVVTVTTGPGGSGKTYTRGVRFVLEEFLPQSNGRHISNFPFHVERLAALYREQTGTFEDVGERVQVIPREVLEGWKTGDSGPWDYFAEGSIVGCHIALDECHEILHDLTKRSTVKRWIDWLGTLRHERATIEFLSQARSKIHPAIWKHAGARVTVYNADLEPEPFFGVCHGDWYRLWGAIRGRPAAATVTENHWQEQHEKWEQVGSIPVSLRPDYFACYESYSKSRAPEGALSVVEALGLLLQRNARALVLRFALVLVGVFFLCGGGSWAIGLVVGVPGMLYSSLAGAGQESSLGRGLAGAAGTGGSLESGARVGGGGGVAIAEPRGGVGAGDAERMGVTVERVAELEKENERLRAELAERDSLYVRSFVGEVVVLSDGRPIAIGEVWPVGPPGALLVGVDHRRGRCWLSDGRAFGIGRRAGVIGGAISSTVAPGGIR